MGCAGGRLLNHMTGRITAEFIAINTDRRELDACLGERKILIGEARFQGRGGAKPHVIMEESAVVVTKPIPWEGLDHLAHALVAIKMLAGVEWIVTVPLGGLLRRGVSAGAVRRAGDELVARAVVRLMTPAHQLWPPDVVIPDPQDFEAYTSGGQTP